MYVSAKCIVEDHLSSIWVAFWIVLLLVGLILCCSILHKEAKCYVLFKASGCGSISVHVTGKKVPAV